MLKPTRYAAAEYRYGFNGQEKVDEIAGQGNHYTAEFWEYDSRTGRQFLNFNLLITIQIFKF